MLNHLKLNVKQNLQRKITFTSRGLKLGFHMIATVGDASRRQAQGHIRDSCVKWRHFLSVADQTGIVRGCIQRAEFKAWFPYDHYRDLSHMSPTDRGLVANVSQWVADCYDHMETRF